MSNNLTIVEKLKIVDLKFQKCLYFLYNSFFGKNCNSNRRKKVHEPVLDLAILNQMFSNVSILLRQTHIWHGRVTHIFDPPVIIPQYRLKLASFGR